MNLLPLDTRAFKDAWPFPHAVFDDFVDDHLLLRHLDADRPTWKWMEQQKARIFKGSENEHLKAGLSNSAKFPASFQRLLAKLHSPEILEKLELLTGIEDLHVDPLLTGAGIHVMAPGARLGIHCDENRYGGMFRRLNLILYLTRDWQREWDGALELWPDSMASKPVPVLPVFNRAVIFETRPDTPHGGIRVSDKALRERCSFSVFYFTKTRPEDWKDIGITGFRKRPTLAV